MTEKNNSALPRHVAIIMDGNGRWAKKRFLPRAAGHKVGVETVRRIVECCVEKEIAALTLYAFSTENWRRPEEEVGYLMGLFLKSLRGETKKLHKQNIQLRFIGDRSRLNDTLQQEIQQSEDLMKENTGLKLVIAINYGSQWEICEAMNRLLAENNTLSQVTPEMIQSKLETADLPELDLFIRTSGEKRISNFLLWQLAYAELYFTDVLWPDFDEKEFNKALDYFARSERRFGYTGDQIKAGAHA